MNNMVVLKYKDAIKQAKQATIEVYDALNYKYISISGYIIEGIEIDSHNIPFSASRKYFYYLRHRNGNQSVIDSITENVAIINFYGMFITDVQLPFYSDCDLTELEIISYNIKQ